MTHSCKRGHIEHFSIEAVCHLFLYPIASVNQHSNIAILLFYTAQKMKFSIKDLFSKCDQIHSFLWIWSHLLKKSLMENFIFCAVLQQHMTASEKTINALETISSNESKLQSIFDVDQCLHKTKYGVS